MAPVVKRLAETSGVESSVCVTAQHRQMLDQVLDLFDITPDFDLDTMRANQSLADITTSVLTGVSSVLTEFEPDRILVHGDTTTTFAAALVAFYHQIPVGHVEAGLRTRDFSAPFPEEMNRTLADTLSDIHFAPTQAARSNLLAENIPDDQIIVTGNTIIDALKLALELIRKDPNRSIQLAAKYPFLEDDQRRTVLVTGHRRENFGLGFENICTALARLSEREDIRIVYPVHLNPNVQEPVMRILGECSGVHLMEPLSYFDFVFLMERCHFVVTDSGGIQEEAPSLGKPVLVMREVTERQEAIAAGTVRLVGTDTKTIVENCEMLLDDDGLYEKMQQAHNPYGDGLASARIVKACVEKHG